MNIIIPKTFSQFEILNSLDPIDRQNYILNLLEFGVEIQKRCPIKPKQKQLYEEKSNSDFDNRIKINESLCGAVSKEQKEVKKERGEVKQLQQIENDINSMKIQMLSLNSLLGGGTKKGKIAEGILIKNLYKLLPDAEINDTGYQIGKGDIYIHYKGYNIMVEVKNYSSNIPRTEKDKFHRDLLQNTYHAGILVSCRSGISGTDKFEHKYLGNKFAIYLSNTGSDGESIMWAILFIVAGLDLSKRIMNNDEHKKEIIISYVQSQSLNLENCVNDIAEMNNQLYSVKSNVNRLLTNGINNMEISINLTKQKLGNIIISFKQLIEKGTMNSNVNLLQMNKTQNIETTPPDSTNSKLNGLNNKKVTELKDLAKKYGLKVSKKKKNEIIEMLTKVKKQIPEIICKSKKSVNDDNEDDDEDEDNDDDDDEDNDDDEEDDETDA